MLIDLTCRACGEPFQAKRAHAKWCSKRCSKRGQRTDAGSVLVALPARTDADEEGGSGEPPLVRSVTETLAAADRLDTWQGQAALVLARQACSSSDTGSAKATVVRQLNEVMAEALRGAGAGDRVNELEERMARKLAGGA